MAEFNKLLQESMLDPTKFRNKELRSALLDILAFANVDPMRLDTIQPLEVEDAVDDAIKALLRVKTLLMHITVKDKMKQIMKKQPAKSKEIKISYDSETNIVNIATQEEYLPDIVKDYIKDLIKMKGIPDDAEIKFNSSEKKSF